MTARFVTAPRKAAKRPPGVRVTDTDEILTSPATADATEQSDRCADCGVPFCQSACPLQNNIPDWLRLASEGRLQEAWDLAASTSAMPEICGRICPQDRLCEGACTLEQAGFESVTIGSVEAWLGDQAWANGWVQSLKPGASTGLSVGIVGSGPAGLAAADRLRSAGHDVVVYDRHDRPGGLLIYGIPGFKLDKAVVERRTRRLSDAGVVFRLNTEIGRDIGFDELRHRHDAVLLAMGVYRPVELGWAPNATRVALDYLIDQNRADLGDHPAPDEARDRDVIVIGGGDTAMDCVRTAVRQGARSVTCLYRRDRAGMPGSAREVLNAEEEGVRFEWLASPVARTETGVQAVRMRLTPGLKRSRIEPLPGTEFEAKAQLVIAALGFQPEAWSGLDLDRREDGTIRTRAGATTTSLPGVFAAGDAVRGASLVVWAVREGQDAAAEINRWLAAQAGEAAA